MGKNKHGYGVHRTTGVATSHVTVGVDEEETLHFDSGLRTVIVLADSENAGSVNLHVNTEAAAWPSTLLTLTHEQAIEIRDGLDSALLDSVKVIARRKALRDAVREYLLNG